MSNSTLGFKDDSTNNNDPQDDYLYDTYGNMTLDQNKTITSIVYNHLNLPLQINFTNGGIIKYVYDATGVKQSKTVTVNNTGSTTKYINGFQYRAERKENSRWLFLANEPAFRVEANGLASEVELQFFPTAEGYVNHTITNNQSYFNYVFNYTDHLGNIRLNYTWDEANQDISILEEHHYYPFGLELINLENTAKKAYSKEETVDVTTATGTIKAPIITQVPNSGYQYQYQGQERQDELGLNWDSFKYRNYDYAIGRFMNVDPLAMEYPYNSTYAFQENKMGLGRELEGLELGTFEWMNNNPFGVIEEGFRQYFDAISSMVDVEAGVVYTNSTPVTNGTIINTSNDKVVKTVVTVDTSTLFDNNGNSTTDVKQKFQEAVKVKTTTSFEAKSKVSAKAVVDGVPVNISNATTKNSEGVTKNKTEASVGVSSKNGTEANIYTSHTTTTNKDGTKSSKTAVGAKVGTPVKTDQDPKTKEKVEGYIQIQTK